MHFCPNCGTQLPPDAAFCSHCGHQLSQPVPGPRRRRWPIFAGLLILAALIGGGLLFRPREEPVDSPDSASLAAAPTMTPVEVVPSASPAPTDTAAPPTIPATPQPTETPQPSHTPLPVETVPPTRTPWLTTTPPPTRTPWATVTPLATRTILPTLTLDPGPESLLLGQSPGGRPIEMVRFGSGANHVVLIGGLHAGFAPGSVSLARQAADYFRQNPQAIPGSVTLYIILSANPDAPLAPGELSGRLNSRGVDLNRNWDCRWVRDAQWRNQVVPGSGGEAPLSEPEALLLANFLVEKQAAAVIFWEARAIDGLVSPGNCGIRTQVSASLATTYGQASGYRVSDFENLTNQEINGDGTNWLDNQGIPAISVLLPDYSGSDWEPNRAGILAVLDMFGE